MFVVEYTPPGMLKPSTAQTLEPLNWPPNPNPLNPCNPETPNLHPKTLKGALKVNPKVLVEPSRGGSLNPLR